MALVKKPVEEEGLLKSFMSHISLDPTGLCSEAFRSFLEDKLEAIYNAAKQTPNKFDDKLVIFLFKVLGFKLPED